MKKLFFILLILISNTICAEDTYDASTGILHMPDVNVGGTHYAVDMLHEGNYIFKMTAASPSSTASTTSNSIVGSWEISGETFTAWALIFYRNGDYIQYESRGGDSCTGVELGSYTWDANTGNVDITLTKDENGNCGPGSSSGLNIKVNADTAIMTCSDCGELTINRIK